MRDDGSGNGDDGINVSAYCDDTTDLASTYGGIHTGSWRSSLWM